MKIVQILRVLKALNLNNIEHLNKTIFNFNFESLKFQIVPH